MDKLLEKASDGIYAHSKIKNSKIVFETLKEHALHCKNCSNRLPFKNILMTTDLFDELSMKLIDNMLLFHDFGKANPRFQKDNMHNKLKNYKKEYDLIGDTNHSLASGYFYILYHLKIYNNYILENDDEKHLKEIILNGYIISRHHAGLKKTLKEFFNELKTADKTKWIRDFADYLGIPSLDDEINTDVTYETFLDIIIDSINEDKINEIEFYTKMKIIYSYLIVIDSIATNEFYQEEEFKYHEPLNTSQYYNSEIYKSIIDYKNGLKKYDENNINKLRSDMALESLNSIDSLHENIMFLEAPCGAGKTNTSLLIACKLMDKFSNLNGIIYTSPFNAITTQNVQVFKNYFNNIQEITSSSMINTIEYKEDEIERMVMDYQLNNFNFIATSHIHLFKILFGTSRIDLSSLLFLANKIVIIDEIQTYKPSIWKFMINMLNSYAKLLNMKILIMSATLPDLSKFLDNSSIKNLIKNRDKYFLHPLFKDRVKFDYIGVINNLNEIIKEEEFYINKKVLYEFITKKTAKKFYDLIKNKMPNKEIYLLDGDCSTMERMNIINRAKENIDIIIVTTQVIEAGVDLDFDYGFKDSSIPDSEIQFLGRINRSCKKTGTAEFFDYDSKKIYKTDVRLSKTISNKEIQKAIRESNNELLYNAVIKLLESKANKLFGKESYDEFLQNCRLFECEEIEKKMTLIEATANIYIAFNMIIKNINNNLPNDNENIILQKNDIKKTLNELEKISKTYNIEVITKQNNDIIINGKNIWLLSESIKNNKKIDFSSKFLQLKIINIYKNYFTFVFYVNKNMTLVNIEKISEYLYYTEDDSYIENGKINRDKLKENNFL